MDGSDDKKVTCSNDAKSETQTQSETQPEVQTMSKNQMKKLAKKQKWEAVKHEKRREEKQRKKRKLAEKKKNGEDLGPRRKELRKNTMRDSSCRIRAVIDLNLDEYMNDKDMKSLTDQVRHCYSANRRATNPMQLYLCGSSGKTRPRLDEIGDIKSWDVHLDSRPYEAVFPKESLVYLTSDSPNMLSDLQEDKVYIIGGLVDHNMHKGLCHRLAEEKGITHGQLPIGEFFQMSTRKVLAVNHVFNIILKYTEAKDWKQAFLSEMPQRKAASLTEKGSQSKVVDNDNTATTNLTTQTDEKDKRKSEASVKNEEIKTETAAEVVTDVKDVCSEVKSETQSEVVATEGDR